MSLWHLWTISIRAHEIHWAQAIAGAEEISATEHFNKVFQLGLSHSCIAQKPRSNILSQCRQSALPAKSHFYLFLFLLFQPLTPFFADLDEITPPSQDLQPQNPSTLLQTSHLPLKHHLFALFTLNAFLSNSLTCFHYELTSFMLLLVCFLLPGFLSIYLPFSLDNRKNIPEISQKAALLENKYFHTEYQL